MQDLIIYRKENQVAGKEIEDEVLDMQGLLTMRQAAKEFGCSYGTVQRWVALGSLRAVRMPSSRSGRRTVRIRRKDIEAILGGTVETEDSS